MPDLGWDRALLTEDTGNGYSIAEIKGEKQDYGIGVVLDTKLFDGVKPRYWGKVLGKFVYENLAGTELRTFDENGNEQTVYLARENDRVRKDGANNSHRVIDKLARYTGDNTRALAVVHISELLATSEHENTTDEHNHQWMDSKGWELRRTYIQDMAGNIYSATLNIARGNDRNLLYDINNVRRIDKGSTAGGDVSSARRSGRDSLTSHNASSDGRIAQNDRNVKKKFSLSPTEKAQRPQERAETAAAKAEEAKQDAQERIYKRSTAICPACGADRTQDICSTPSADHPSANAVGPAAARLARKTNSATIAAPGSEPAKKALQGNLSCRAQTVKEPIQPKVSEGRIV